MRKLWNLLALLPPSIYVLYSSSDVRYRYSDNLSLDLCSFAKQARKLEQIFAKRTCQIKRFQIRSALYKLWSVQIWSDALCSAKYLLFSSTALAALVIFIFSYSIRLWNVCSFPSSSLPFFLDQYQILSIHLPLLFPSRRGGRVGLHVRTGAAYGYVRIPVRDVRRRCVHVQGGGSDIERWPRMNDLMNWI